jgi:alpha-glucosidase
MRRASLDAPPVFRLAARSPGRLDLESDTAARAHIFVLEDDIVRLLVLPEGGITGPPTWSIAPGAPDVSAEGRDRFDISGFANPEAKVSEADGKLVIETARIRLSIRLNGLKCHWQVFDREWKEAFRDRPTQAYDFGWWAGRVRHFLAREADEQVFGLGEVSGDQDRSGRRVRLAPIDAFGYSARTSGPLYKHIPFSITRRPQTGVSFGLFYDTYADCAFDLGCERDNYHGLYRSFEAEAGDLDLYVIAGADPGAIARRFTWLTGRPALMPAWTLGYSGSTMALADAADAPGQLLSWLDECRARDIPCPSFHLSSGYSETGGRRYVFQWNLEKFPDPRAFVAAFADRGVRLVANIKPALLIAHPDFEEAAGRGLFIRQAGGAPALAQFWDGLGAWLDFTNPQSGNAGLVEGQGHGLAARCGPRRDLERQQRVRGLVAIGRDPRRAGGGDTRGPAAPDDARLARGSDRARPGKAPVRRQPLRLRRDAALCPDLVGRQRHLVGDPALQPEDGPRPRAQRRLQ